LARGNIGMPGLGGTKFSSDAHKIYLKDHQREQEKIQQQRDSRSTGRSNAEREAERSNVQVAEKSPFLGNEFKDAKTREENNPAEKQRDDRSQERKRDDRNHER
jgi:polysaccharide deacetylase 2 family uncharacterized protein YibQ